jgi:hypothetical protein
MFEWGQTPLVRRMPKKRWFTAIDSIKYFVINVSLLQKLAEKWIIEINKESLISAWILKKKDSYIKLLWDWELKSKINLTVNAASKQGIEKVEKAWGKIEIIQIKVTKLVKIPYSERQDKLIKKPKVKIEPKETKVKKEAIKDEEKVELKAEKTPKAKVVKKVEKKVEKKSEKKTTPKKKAVK